MAAVLAGGRSTLDIRQAGKVEHAVSQVYIALRIPDDGAAAGAGEGADGLGGAAAAQIESIIADLHAASPASEGGSVSYPGEGMLEARRRNLAEGVPVDKKQWADLQAM